MSPRKLDTDKNCSRHIRRGQGGLHCPERRGERRCTAKESTWGRSRWGSGSEACPLTVPPSQATPCQPQLWVSDSSLALKHLSTACPIRAQTPWAFQDSNSPTNHSCPGEHTSQLHIPTPQRTPGPRAWNMRISTICEPSGSCGRKNRVQRATISYQPRENSLHNPALPPLQPPLHFQPVSKGVCVLPNVGSTWGEEQS